MTSPLPGFRQKHSIRLRARSRQATALVLVLASLVLVVIVALSFFSSVSSETVASRAQGDAAFSSQLSDSVVKLVMATISEASIGKSGTDRTTWASQPGMIRTWDDSGNPDRVFRLYSAPNMIEDGTTFSPDADATALAGWKSGAASYNALWCDLNSPVTSSTSSTSLVYPIVTPPNTLDAANGVAKDDPSTAAQEGVQGFDITSSPGYSGSSPSSSNNPAPMPVRWIYVLKDGQLANPTGNGTTVTVTDATAANPIVGRVAFWTDDETSKVNVNTASEGSFWDYPRQEGKRERDLAVNLPARGEFQRLPGHPFTVSLSPILHNFAGGAEDPVLRIPDATRLANAQSLLALTPRAMWGGSQMGTSLFPPPIYPLPGDWATRATTTKMSIIPKTDRLYASVDEFLYAADNTTPRTINTGLTADQVSPLDFFLTAHSRAPEVNLFDKPRVSIWPITWSPTANLSGIGTSPALSTNLAYMTPEEGLLAFCGTLHDYRYYFQRQDSKSSTQDFDGITRNRELYDYLADLMSKPEPGFGGNFLGKYGNDRSQILTSIFDFIRSGPNLNNRAKTMAGTSDYFYSPKNFRGTGGEGAGGGGVAPILITRGGVETRGAGRFMTIGDVALLFYAAERREPVFTRSETPAGAGKAYTIAGKNLISSTAPGTVGVKFTTDATGALVSTEPVAASANPPGGQTSAGAQTTKMGGVLLFNPMSSLQGYISNLAYYAIVVNGSTIAIESGGLSGNWTVSGTAVVDSAQYRSPAFFCNSIRAFRGYESTLYYRGSSASTPKVLGSSNQVSGYPFVGMMNVNPDATTFTFTGQPLTVEIWSVDYTNNTKKDKLQTMTIDLNQMNGTYPIPVAPHFVNQSDDISNPPSEEDPAEVAYRVAYRAPLIKAPAAGVIPEVVPPVDPIGSLVRMDLITQTSPSTTFSMIPAEEFSENNAYLYAQNTLTSLTPVAPATGSWTFSTPVTGATPAADPPVVNASNLLSFQNRVLAYGGNTDITSYYAPKRTINPKVGYRWGPGIGFNVPLICENYNRSLPALKWTDTRANNPFVIRYPGPDTVIGMELAPSAGVEGDYRLLSFRKSVPSDWFAPHPDLAIVSAGTHPGFRSGYSLTPAHINMAGLGRTDYHTLIDAPMNDSAWGSGSYQMPTIFSRPVTSTLGLVLGDWNNGIGDLPDGAILMKPDETFFTLSPDPLNPAAAVIPFFTQDSALLVGTVDYFSPARQMPGPVIFGQLPSQVLAEKAWQTLLFNPNPLVGAGHKGFASPQDHLLLDLFWMPTVEPYPISEPLSTAGKINLNYQMMPFTGIQRQTGMYALLKAAKITAMLKKTAGYFNAGPANNRTAYKLPDKYYGGDPVSATYFHSKETNNNGDIRYAIDIPATLLGFDASYTANGPLRSSSQICEMTLVPKGISGVTDVASTKTWWTGTGAENPLITGANTRQQPYLHLYQLVTTKSNTFTVHMRVQGLRKRTTSDPTLWEEGKDPVVSEYRGSATVERYVDPNDPDLPDFATSTGGNPTKFPDPEECYSLSSYYRWRGVQKRQFSP